MDAKKRPFVGRRFQPVSCIAFATVQRLWTRRVPDPDLLNLVTLLPSPRYQVIGLSLRRCIIAYAGSDRPRHFTAFRVF